MQCPNCGGEELHSSVTVYRDYVQRNGEWQSVGEDRQDRAQIACTSCGHEWTENQDLFEDITLSSDEPVADVDDE